MVKQMLKVAITGNIASGKSTVEKFLVEKGYKVLDTDTITHVLILENDVKNKIVEIFKGFDILENGEISRPKLGKIVFENENLRKKHEQVLHPLIKEKIQQFFIDNNSEKFVFVLIPLLFEAKFEDLFDKKVLVYAEDTARLSRLIERSNLSTEDAQNRLKSQISQEEKIPLADYVIYNTGDIDALSAEVEELLNYLDKNSTFPESK